MSHVRLALAVLSLLLGVLLKRASENNGVRYNSRERVAVSSAGQCARKVEVGQELWCRIVVSRTPPKGEGL